MDTQNIPPEQVQPQATVNLAKVNSRIGFAAHIALICVWVLAYFSAGALYAIIASAMGMENSDPTLAIIILVAVAVPLVPIFWFANHRLNTMLASNSGNVEDVNFKGQVRKSLRNAIIIGVIFIAYKIFRILGMLFLDHSGDPMKSFISLIVYGSALGLVAYYSWHFYNKMKS